MSIETWKDGEVSYCKGLVRAAGDANVPAGAITSYLNVQLACAVRDGRQDVVNELIELREVWISLKLENRS